MDTARPFAGIEVVEFGQFIAVPFCAQVLSEGGAHVIKVESVEGDPVRQLAPLAPGETRHFVSRNRGEHSLPLDLRHPSAGPIVERLLARADVVLTNFRPGLAAELGLDWASLAPRHPRLRRLTTRARTAASDPRDDGPGPGCSAGCSRSRSWCVTAAGARAGSWAR